VLRRQSLLGGKAIQRYVGYAALALLAVRFVWGFIGTQTCGHNPAVG
jgi:cytochrome b